VTARKRAAKPAADPVTLLRGGLPPLSTAAEVHTAVADALEGRCNRTRDSDLVAGISSAIAAACYVEMPLPFAEVRRRQAARIADLGRKLIERAEEIRAEVQPTKS